ncbi:MAG: replication-relaxation family protein [Verrucomicrobiaceae bacterium]|nr:replication-relaxation family protein [Verrucomicrobiaceae bacterium]
MTEKQQRLPRFTRDPDAAGSFQFTQRDLEILRHVAEHRFIRSEWLIKLAGGSRQQLLRRLNLLYHHGYLERPRCQLDYYHEGGSKSLVYGLASRGAGRLRRDLDMPFERMDWTTRNKGIGRLFLEHTLMVSDFMAALELDCRQRPDVRLLFAHELPQPKGRENHREPFRWTVDLPGKRHVGVVPDKVFALEVTRPEGCVERTYYFLEADRGTMPIERRDIRQSSVMRKIISYQATMASKAHLIRLNVNRFRVLVLARNLERVRHLQTAIADLKISQRGRTVIHHSGTPSPMRSLLA